MSAEEPAPLDPRIVELERLLDKHPGVTLVLGWPEAVALGVYLDVALSHPYLEELPSYPVVKAIRESIAKLLAGDNQRIADMLRTGRPPADWN